MKAKKSKPPTAARTPKPAAAAAQAKPQGKTPPFPIVGVGASAGGLEAVTQLLRHLPGDARMAIVLVQHLDPSQPSALVGLLSRVAKLQVVAAADRMRVERGHVYVIPPNKMLGISDGILRLQPRESAAEPHAPVNFFFRALAEDQGHRAIGIILSGTGHDGSDGLEAIKAADGITFAQTEKSAKHPGMPNSASSSADFILSPEEIARELVRVGSHPRAMRKHPEGAADLVSGDGSEFKQVCTLLLAHAGIDFSHYKPNTLGRRISRRMVLLKKDSIPRYIARLRESPGELDALVQDILISVTGFFRDPEAFAVLNKKILPRILKHKSADEPIRVWVPGCSTGEEVFSLAITLVEFMEKAGKKCPIQLFGTDVNETILARARAATFPETIKGDVSPERLRRFFTRTDGSYRICKAIREVCVFARQNVVADPPFSKVDLISCRNVLIYFGAPMQRTVIPVFHYALNPHGFLLLGTAESVSGFAHLFELVDAKHRIYAKRAVSERVAIRLPPFAKGPENGETPAPGMVRRGPETILGEIRKQADALVLGEFAPGGVVVNSRMDILQFRGRTEPFLVHGPGAASLNLLQMARQGLAVELRPLIARATKQHRAVTREGVQMRDDGRLLSINVRVIPFQVQPSEERFFLVLFEQKAAVAAVTATGVPKGKAGRTTVARREIAQLREELAVTKQSLHTLMEEHETSDEELRAANEEALSSNEELQSTNEELETAKEELQSTNEELTTLNEELQNRNVELQEVSDDLLNLFASVDFSVVMLDRELRIRRFTPKAQAVLSLIPGDLGRPITDLKCSLDLPDLHASIVRVLDSLNVEEREIQDRAGHWYGLRIRPYRTADNRINGVVLTLLDIDALKRSLAESEHARRLADSIVATVREPLLVLDGMLRVKMANRKFYETFQVKPEDTENRFIYELGGGRWDFPNLRELLEKILPAQTTLEDFSFAADFPIVGRKNFLLNARRLANADGGPDWILLAMQDADERP
jgi:two-component system CheB/CheR fusion protein